MTSSDGVLPFLDALPQSARLIDARLGIAIDKSSMSDAAHRTANSLKALGVRRGDRVVLSSHDPIKLLRCLFGCWAAGACAILVPPSLTAPERANLQARLSPALWCDTEPVVAEGRSDPPPTPIGLDDAAVVLLTSGTTGTPKGVALTLRTLFGRCALNEAHIGRDKMQDTLCLLPLQFGHGLIGNTLTPLLAGGAVHLRPSPNIAEWAGVATYIDAAGITFLSSVPVHWRMLTRLPAPEAATLLRVHIGSAPLSRSLWEAVADWTGTREVWNMFGMTECANWISGAPLDGTEGDGCIGRPWGGSAAVRTVDGDIAAMGVGELLVQSPTFMSGYLNDPERTDAAMIGHWFRTGDMAEIAGSGMIRLTGRTKSEINRGGQKIHPEEIDMALEDHADVLEACAFGVPDPLAGETVGAAVVLRDGATIDVAQFDAWLRARMRAEAVPSRLWILDALPRSDRGKVLRDAVREAAMGPSP
jgi:acyl-CoA synthetase (AMP-forming)/AMP-acid ligase II